MGINLDVKDVAGIWSYIFFSFRLCYARLWCVILLFEDSVEWN
jgi:hypothetical protein